MQFTITITDTAKLAGIAAARARHQAEYPASPVATDNDYIQLVVDSAAASYATQFADPKEAQITSLTATNAALAKENDELRAAKSAEGEVRA